ncbi:long-chain fatty acid transport protein 6 [Elysia marginata]|uniref:long-chain-fatty-acid--CoA ligase n=1 Tax=Elysia marginata TaxID=1093978 RepID=A0AAV4HZD4_9GAST|nr:long-chain fatty acid transport protein 6 [Elysia marginata]
MVFFRVNYFFKSTGCSLLLRKRFSASEFWNDCRSYDVTIVLYVGEILRYLLSQPKSELDGVHKIRMLGGNGLRADIFEEFQTRFKIPFICEVYSQTEAPSYTLNFFGKPGSIGRLSPFYSRLDPDKKCLVKFDQATALPIRNAQGRCIRVEIGEAGLLLSKVPDQLKGKKIYKAGEEATEKKMVRDVFVPGDCYMNYGDALVLDKEYFLYFYDRLGDTFRWKGSNVSTTEVANVISSLTFVEDANVYGITIPDHEGKAGMAAINLIPQAQLGDEELRQLYVHVSKELPKYARPLFLRHLPEAVLTGTFKNSKTELAQQGYDLSKVKDPVYFIDHENQTYSPLRESNVSTVINIRL